MSTSEIQPRQVRQVAFADLKLDAKNPRLAGRVGAKSDAEVIAELYRREELSELIQSIATNGYLDIEPLIVLIEDKPFTVLEGNRRLAAVRLLTNPDLVNTVNNHLKGAKLNLPTLDEDKLNTLEKVKVYPVLKREDARAFIGFKHINGAAKWDSFSKARFAAEWYSDGGVSLDDIADAIGDTNSTIKRMVNAVYVLEQAKEQGVFDIDDRVTPRFNFSHLYTALSRRPYMDYLGLEVNWSNLEPKENPICSSKLERLKDILLWIYGSKENLIEPVIQSQNPDIKRLGEVIASQNTEGIMLLKYQRGLDAAYESIRSADEVLASSLLRARQFLRDAVNHLKGYSGEDVALLDISEDIKESAETIYERMLKKTETWRKDE